MKNPIVLLLIIVGIINFPTTTQSQENPLEKYYDAVEWRHIGPYRGGRSCAVTGVPDKPMLYYFGSTGGGVWKTQDGGQSYENISDGFFGGSIGAIQVSQSDPNVIYVGGGEKTVRGNVSFGYGVWKSQDAGKTWSQMGLEKSRHISRIRINPNDHNIAYAAVMGDLFKSSDERGIYKTIDGGDTWKRVLFANKDAGAVDLIIDPNNSRILYATTWNIRRTPYSLSSGGDGSSIWKSIDSGETWTEIKENKGLPEGTWGISAVTVSPANSNRVWAIIENEKGGVYRSDDGGETWKKTNDERKLRQRAWYYTRIYADSQDENIVYVVNVNYHKSNDGGNSFESFRAPHGDHHDLWIAPEDNQRMIIGDDGGAQVSYDGGGNWSTYHNQATAQFYRVTTDNHFPFRIYVAQQDNSTIRISHRTEGWAITESDWERTAGGESAHIAVDPKNNDIVYGGSYDGYLTRLDHSTNLERAVNVYPDNPMGHGAEGMKYRFQWNFPILFSRFDKNKLFTFSNHVHQSTNEGQSWELLSPDLTRNDPEKLKSSGGPITQDNTSVEYYCTIFAAAESYKEEGVLWVGSDDGLMHITTDGGENWQNITPSNLPEWTMINCIEADPHNAGGAYIAATSYKLGDYTPYLFKTKDYGKSWQKITKGIPIEHFTRAIRVDPNQEGMLYAGTESGMYVSWDDGANWQNLQMNLPIVPITDLTIKQDKLIASTQGRSIWMIDDLSVIRNAKNLSNNTTAYLFKPLDSYRMKGSQNKKIKGAGINHPGGVMVNYYIEKFDEEKDSISLTFYDNAGDTIRSYSSFTDKKENKLKIENGSNQYVWNMKYPDAASFEGMIMWWGSMAGPKAMPGEYSVSLNYNGEIQNQKFKILKDPRTNLSDAEMEENIDFINEVNNLVTESHESIKEMHKIKNQINNYKDLITDSIVLNKIESVTTNLDSLEKELYQTKNQSRQDPLNFPIKLTNKLAHLNSLIQIGDYPPTDGMIQVKNVISAEINTVLDSYKAIKTKDIPELNKMIKESVTEFIKVE